MAATAIGSPDAWRPNFLRRRHATQQPLPTSLTSPPRRHDEAECRGAGSAQGATGRPRDGRQPAVQRFSRSLAGRGPRLGPGCVQAGESCCSPCTRTQYPGTHTHRLSPSASTHTRLTIPLSPSSASTPPSPMPSAASCSPRSPPSLLKTSSSTKTPVSSRTKCSPNVSASSPSAATAMACAG